MSKLDTPTIQRAHPERARQISQDACRGQEWIQTPAALATTLALLAVIAAFLAIGAIGMVRP